MDFIATLLRQTNRYAGTICQWAVSTPQILSAPSMSQSQPSYSKVLPAHSWGPFSHLYSCLPCAPLPQYHKKLVGADGAMVSFLHSQYLLFLLFPLHPLHVLSVSYSCSHLNGCTYKDKYILPLTKSHFWSDLNFRVCLSLQEGSRGRVLGFIWGAIKVC